MSDKIRFQITKPGIYGLAGPIAPSDEIHTADAIPQGWVPFVTILGGPKKGTVAVTNPAGEPTKAPADMNKPELVAALESTGWPGDVRANKPELLAALEARTATLTRLSELGWTGDPSGKDDAALAAEIETAEQLKALEGGGKKE